MKCGTVRLILPYQAKVVGFDRRRKFEPARHFLFELLLKLGANNFITAAAIPGHLSLTRPDSPILTLRS